MKIIVYTILALGLTSQAVAGSYLSCANGTIDEVGDSLFRIEVREDKMVLLPYESSVEIPMSDIEVSSNKISSDSITSFSISNKTYSGFSEGDETQTAVTGDLFLVSDKVLVGSLTLDGNKTILKMKCEKTKN